MNTQNISVKALMDSIVPMSRFKQGDVQEIFNEVKVSGTKIVLENNEPSCVLINPIKYQMLLEALEDYELYIEAVTRSKDTNCKTYTHDEICDMYGITEEDLEDVEVEIE